MSELMRRATPGIALAGAALATVWLFDPAMHPDPVSSTTAGDGANTSESGTPDPGAGSDTGSGGSAASDGSAQDPAQAATDCTNPTAVSGEEAMTQWGPVQVRVEVAADGTVCGVQAIAYPDGDRHSAMLNASAIPYLDSAASSQGIQFDAFSGATYTSEAYRQSMQSALDR